MEITVSAQLLFLSKSKQKELLFVRISTLDVNLNFTKVKQAWIHSNTQIKDFHKREKIGADVLYAVEGGRNRTHIPIFRMKR